jgi:hypothetical protein
LAFLTDTGFVAQLDKLLCQQAEIAFTYSDIRAGSDRFDPETVIDALDFLA